MKPASSVARLRSPVMDARSSPMFHHIFRADPFAVRQTLGELRARLGATVGPEMLDRLELVLAEVLNNIVEHGGGAESVRGAPWAPQVHLCIVSHEGGLACAVTDDGVVLPDECLRPRALPGDTGAVEELPEGGFGWYLIQDLTQALCYFREGPRNFLSFHVSLMDDEE